MQFTGLDKVLGMELKLIGANLYDCRFCTMVKKNDTVQIIRRDKICGSLVEVLAQLPKDIPVALNLTGKGILYKCLDLDHDFTEDQVFQNAFPAVELNDFYRQCYREGSHCLVNIVRRTLVDDLLLKFKGSGLSVYLLSLGAIVTAQVWPLLNNYSSEIEFDGHYFKLDSQKQFLAYQHLPEPVKTALPKFQLKIGEETTSPSAVIAYASAMQLTLHNQIDIIQASVPSVALNLEGFLKDGKLKRAAAFYLMALFSCLLISFLMLNHYLQANARLSRLIGTQTANEGQIELMKRNSTENEALLTQLQWNGGYNYVFLIHEIGSSMPKQLQLEKVVMNGLKGTDGVNDAKSAISLVGITDNLTALNNWIFILKQKSWIKKVQLSRFQDDPENHFYQFNLQVDY